MKELPSILPSTKTITLRLKRPRENQEPLPPSKKIKLIMPRVDRLTSFLKMGEVTQSLFRYVATAITISEDESSITYNITKESLRDLLYLAQSSKLAQAVISHYLAYTSFLYKNNDIFYKQECFNVNDPQSGIVPFMFNGLYDVDQLYKTTHYNEYLNQFALIFKNQINSCVLNNATTIDAIANQLKLTSGSLQLALRTEKANGLMDLILEDLHLFIQTDDISVDQRNKAIGVIMYLVQYRCFDPKCQTLIDILKELPDLLDREPLIISNTLGLMALLVQARLLKSISSELLNKILSFLNHANGVTVGNTLILLGALAQARFFSLQNLAYIISKVLPCLNRPEKDVATSILLLLSNIAQAGLLKHLPSPSINAILDQIPTLLNHANSGVVSNALCLVCIFEKEGLLRTISLETTKFIIDQSKEILKSRKHNYILIQTLMVLWSLNTKESLSVCLNLSEAQMLNLQPYILKLKHNISEASKAKIKNILKHLVANHANQNIQASCKDLLAQLV